MGLRYSDIADNRKAIRSHTGLTEQEFMVLCKSFAQEWQHYIEHYTLEGQLRQRRSKPRSNNVLSSIEDKLLFVLFFFKTNPLQEVLATTFGLDQPQANRWLELLRERLQETLAKERLLPERKAERLYRVVADKDKVLIDGTEREVGRSIDYETQREYYSGKKKTQCEEYLIS